MFEDLGLKYVGPIDGHDEQAMEAALRKAKRLPRAGDRARAHPEGPRLQPAPENHDEDQFHSPGAFDRATGEPRGPRPPSGPTCSATELVRLGNEREDMVAITAAMLHPTGLDAFADGLPRPHLRRRHRRAARRDQRRRPGARRHAPGRGRLRHLPQPRLRPAPHGRRPARLPGDRSCSTGPASPATTAPATTACGTCRSCRSCPACGSRCRVTVRGCASCSREAVEVDDGPTVRALAEGPGRRRASSRSTGWADGRAAAPRPSPTCCWSASGAMARSCVEAAAAARRQGITVTVVDPRWVKPLDEALAERPATHRLVVVGRGQRSRRRCRRRGGARCSPTPRCDAGAGRTASPSEFLDHAKRRRSSAGSGLTGAGPGPRDHRGGRQAEPVRRQARPSQQAEVLRSVHDHPLRGNGAEGGHLSHQECRAVDARHRGPRAPAA